MKSYFSLLAVILFFCSCHSKHAGKYPYAISDFSPAIQPHLITALNAGGTLGSQESPWSSDYIEDSLSDKDIIKLGQCEHPILRALALEQMVRRKGFDHFKVIMEHLDDTALIPDNDGKFIEYETVSDRVFRSVKWGDNELWWKSKERKIVIDSIVTSHNYLITAYKGLKYFKARDRHYTSIKAMAERHLPYRSANEQEYSLYALASFQKKEDIPFIRNRLANIQSGTGGLLFLLMKDFPDTSYMRLMEQYYKIDFSNDNYWSDFTRKTEDFIYAVASYKSQRSARLLEKIANNLSRIKCYTDTNEIKSTIRDLIWDYPCPYYRKLQIRFPKLVTKPVINHDIVIFRNNEEERGTIPDFNEE